MKILPPFWKNFFIGFFDCYNFASIPIKVGNIKNIKTIWLRVSCYLNAAYKNEIS